MFLLNVSHLKINPLIPHLELQNGLRALIENCALLFISEERTFLDVGDDAGYRAEGCIATENESIDAKSLACHQQRNAAVSGAAVIIKPTKLGHRICRVESGVCHPIGALKLAPEQFLVDRPHLLQ